MGCCNGLKHVDKGLIVNLSPKEMKQLVDFFERNRNDYKITPEKKYRKSSSKTVETGAESPKKPKKSKKRRNLYNHRIKDVANNLRQFAIEEVKNIPTYFAMK